MTGGSPVGRQWLVIRQDGTPLIDWGDGLYQDIASGAFLRGPENDMSRTASDDDLKQLKISGLIFDYDETQVFLSLLPERPTKTLD